MAKRIKVPETFDGTNSCPNPDVKFALARKDTPFNIIDFPTPPQPFQNYEQYLAAEEYKKLLDDFYAANNSRNFGVGMEGDFGNFLFSMGIVLKNIMKKESGHEEQLEKLCEELIRDYFKLDDNALSFNLKLIKTSIKTENTPSKKELKQEQEKNIEEYESLKDEIAKRRIINALTQGNAVDGTYLYRTVRDSLTNILNDDEIVKKYDRYFSIAILGYWQYPNTMMNAIMGVNGNGGAIGKTKLDSTTSPPTIHAEAIVFPLLIHETIKGVMEFLSKERIPENLMRTEKAIEYADQIIHEAWDIRIGPTIWRKFENLLPSAVINDDDKKKLKFYIYSNLVNLPAKEFLVLINEILEQSDDAKVLISAMYYDLCIMTDGEYVPEEEYNFRERMDEIMKKHIQNK